MRVVGLIDFQHTTCLGNAHSHKLFEQVVVERKPDSKTSDGKTKDFPSDLNDYHGTAPGDLANYLPVVADEKKSPVVTARKFVWEIPEKAPNA